MVRKLAVLLLLVLYASTGSVAAFAAHDHCGHRSQGAAQTHATAAATVAEQLPADEGTADPDPVDCDGSCHLLSVALRHTMIELPFRPHLRQVRMAASSDRPSASTIKVPTPPPNVA